MSIAAFASAVVGLLSAQAPIGVPAFTRVDLLPILQPNVQTHQFSSYDRAGDNYDADYFPIYKDPSGEQVLFDSYGPGCLYRLHLNIWNGDLGTNNIRFYFDDEVKPRIDMDVTKFFSGDNPLGIFKEPMAHVGVGYRFLYHPFFYQKHLKIALAREPLGQEPGWDKLPWLGRYDLHPYRRNHWYQFTYHTYREDPGIRSWSAPANMQPVIKAWDPSRIGKPPASYYGSAAGTRDTTLDPGDRTGMIYLNDPGAITAIHMSVAKEDVPALYDTWLTITFDDAAFPQVDVPLGAMFGIFRHSTDKRIASELIGCLGNEMYCYFPMPFWKGASVQLSNRGKRKLGNLHMNIEYVLASSVPYTKENSGYFHAIYHREAPRAEGHDYRYADLQGRGKVLGHLVYRLNTSMEEDERTYFDGSRTPGIYGDGFEDDHNQGWGLHDLQQAIYGSVASDGGAGAPWRFYIPDQYVFQSGIKVGHQVYGPHSPLGHEGMYQVGEEESVTLAYLQDEPGLKLTDEVDVGNSKSVAEHHYRSNMLAEEVKGNWWYDGEDNNVLFKLPSISDEGLSTDKGSEFTLKLTPENNGVRLRRRLDKENNQQLAKVYIDGKLVSERPWYSVDFERTFRGIRWMDCDFEIPAKYTRGKKEIKVKIDFVSSETGKWDEYHYWAFCYR